MGEENSGGSVSTVVEVADELVSHLPLALARIGYLFPEWLIQEAAGTVRVTAQGASAAQIRTEVLHALYREHVFAETLEMRRKLMAMVTSA